MPEPTGPPEPTFTSPESIEALATLDRDRVPAHVAVIMDGNGRWAAKRRLPRVAGHKAGAKAVREAILAAIGLGVRHLTLYSFSSENWNRPLDEISGLMRLFVEVLEEELSNLERMDVRVRLVGRDEGVPAATLAAFRGAEERTAGNTALDLMIALNYGGRAELVDAAAALARDVQAGALSPDDVDEKQLASRLYAPDAPDPDLLIRTSGEMRVSNFLLWQIAYSEIWVTDVLWPDFSRDDFLEAVLDYQARGRRFGA